MSDVNEVRKAAEAILETPPTFEEWQRWHCLLVPAALKCARFALSVIEPPPEVAEAMERLRSDSRWGSHIRVIADYYLSLTAPTPDKPIAASEKEAGRG